MALIVENGSIVTNANTYVTTTDFDAYLSARGKFLGGNNGTSEQLLLSAMDYIESRDFAGVKNTKSQPLQWPRTGVYVDGFLVADDEIPADLKYAQIEVAIAIDSGTNPMAPLGRETKREKVGDIEVEYDDGARSTTELVAVNARLNKLLVSGSNVGVVFLNRA